MGKTLRFLRMRALSTKNARQLRQSDVSSGPRYNSVLDLTTVSLGSALALGCLVVVGHVTQHVAGPSVLVSTLFAAATAFLLCLNYAELQSRLPRMPPTTYEHLFHLSGEAAAYCTAWGDMAASMLWAAVSARAISGNIDAISGGWIRNSTLRHTGNLLAPGSYLDFLGFLIVLLALLYLALEGISLQHKMMFTVTNIAVIAVMAFLGIIAAFHLDFHLWEPHTFFQTGFKKTLSGASLLLPILLSQKVSLSLCDFMWLGIRPTIIGTTTITALTLLITFLGTGSMLSLLANIVTWCDESSIPAAFNAASVFWVKYVISPFSVLVLCPYVILFITDSVKTLEKLSKDQLMPACLNTLWNEGSSLPLMSLILTSVTASIVTLISNIEILLRIIAVISLLQAVYVCSLVVVLRYKPAPQQQLQHVEVPESSNLMEGADNSNSNAETYGTVANDKNATTWPRNRRDSDSDIDVAVEEYRIQTATAQCSRGFLHAQPTLKTYSWIKLAMTTFVISATIALAILVHGLSQLNHTAPVIVVFIISVLTSLLCMAVMVVQPKDHVLPKTFLIKLPCQPWLSLVAVLLCVLFLTLLDVVEVSVVVVWIALGLLIYTIQVLCKHDRTYGQLSVSGQQHPAEDINAMATFVTNTTMPAIQMDDSILVP